MIPKLSENSRPSTAGFLLRLLVALFFVYLFLVGISMMGTGAKDLGKGFSNSLVAMTTNPFVGLFIGVLVTSIVQSSSCTTSIAVGLTAQGLIPLHLAIPIIMGSNIGTSVTNVIVSLSHIGRKSEFRRAFAGAIVHDFFNVMTVIVLFPLELTTHFLERTALFLTGVLADKVGVVTLVKPLDKIVKPPVNAIKGLLAEGLSLSREWTGAVLAILGLLLLFVALVLMVKTLRGPVLAKLEPFFDKFLFRNAPTAFMLGLLATAFVQSSSITTSLVVPLVGAGMLTIEQIYPYTLGANIGTTVTALIGSFVFLAAVPSEPAGFTLAITHLLFNVTGAVVFYPVRALPIGAARWYANLAAESKRYALLFLVGMFLVLPGVCIAISELIRRW